MGRQTFPRAYEVRSYGDNSVVIRASSQPAALHALQERVARPDMQGRGMHLEERVLAAKTLQEAVAAWTMDAAELIADPDSADFVRVYVAPTPHADRLALLLNTLAPFIESGSHLELMDSTRAVWTWHFDAGHARNDYTY